MEQYVVYVVQFWVDGYDYWSDSIEPSDRIFGLPKTEEEGRERLAKLTANNPTGKYRLAQRTTTLEVI